MKLKNQFLRLFALLGLSMAATSAWAAEVELQGNATDGFYVNMPTPVKNTRVNAELSITNNDVKSFKVYDDGGATASYTATSCSGTSSISCAVNLLLTAPEDYLLSVAGSLSYISGGKPYLRIYDGADTEASHNMINTQISLGQVLSVGSHLTSGRSMLIQFYTAVNNSGTNEGNLELIIDLVPVNLVIEQSGTSTFEPVKDAFEIQVPASVGDIDNTTTLTAPEGYVLYVANTTTPNGGSMTVDGNLSSSLTVHVTTESSGFASALNVPVHVLKKTTSTTAIDIYTQDDNSYAVAKITDGKYEGAGAVSIPNAVNVDAIVYDRVFTANKAGTIVLPFSLPSSATTNAKFYYLKEVYSEDCKWKATFTNIAKENPATLPTANTPYAVIVQDGSELKFNLNGGKAEFQTASIAEQEDNSGNWYFRGTYEYKTWTEGDGEFGLAYALAAADDPYGAYKAGQYAKVGVGTYATPMHAYMCKKNADVRLGRPLAKGEVSSIEDLPEVIDAEFIDEDGKPMAIGRLNTVTGAVQINRWVDLKGRSTNHKPTTKGVFFNKKGIVK